jgi:hypothetical protein
LLWVLRLAHPGLDALLLSLLNHTPAQEFIVR